MRANNNKNGELMAFKKYASLGKWDFEFWPNGLEKRTYEKFICWKFKDLDILLSHFINY